MSAAASLIERLLACGARRASPFEVLDIPPADILRLTTADVAKRYRPIALMLHPDKCDHPQASDAFQVAQRSYAILSQEAVLAELQRAEEKRQTKVNQEAAEARERKERAAATPQGSLGKRSFLPLSGIPTAEQKANEIKRLLTACRPTDYFGLLDLNPLQGDEAGSSSSTGGRMGEEESSVIEAKVTKKYRKMAQALHPDKCDLPNAAAAFQCVEKAYQELKDPKKYAHWKAFLQQERRKAMRGGRGGDGITGMSDPMSFDERREAAMREHLLASARVAEESMEKKRRVELAEQEKAKMAAELERQRSEWKDLMMM